VMKKQQTSQFISKAMLYLILLVFVAFIAAPFAVMLSTSLKDEASVFTFPPQWIPATFHWENYSKVFLQLDLIKGFVNTLLIIIPPTLLGLLSSAFAAYSFSHLNFKGRDSLFFVFLMTMMLPGVITMIPSYVIFTQLGWVDTWLPLMVPGSFGTAFCTFFLRQSFMTIPKELVVAAKIDGMSHPRIFFTIILPLSKPALVTQAVLGFLAGYNDFLGPLIYINSSQKMTLQLMLSSLQGMYSSNFSILMAGAALAVIPTLILCIVSQKAFVRGITMTGLKG